jgi:polyhydroxyalkanoate synthesis regulator phasin
MRRHIALNALILLSILGCGEEEPAKSVKTVERISVRSAPAANTTERASAPAALGAPSASALLINPITVADKSSGMMGGMAGAMGTAIQAPINSAALSRKIIYDGEIDLIVKDVDSTAKQVSASIQEARGYIAEQSTTGSPGTPRSMRWKLRVPVEQFESLVQKVVALGELEQNKRTSQDVTEQFYDIEARIKNKKAEEKSLTKILDERTGKLEDILKIETELSRVRGEIEQLEGKIRVLENLSSLATLNLSVHEREKFEPPPPAVADFPTQVARTWESSLRSLINLGKACILWAVNWALWIPLLIVAGLLAWVILRRLFRLLPRILALANTPISPPRAQ